MEIKTKFNTDDKVWYYIEQHNQYAWGKIMSLDIGVRVGEVDSIVYHIKNRFYNPNPYGRCYHIDLPFEEIHTLSFNEDEVFFTPEEVKEWLEKKHRAKMDELTELKKKGWFA